MARVKKKRHSRKKIRSRARLIRVSKVRAVVNSSPQDPIKHVVLLMLENRSFDHMLGCLPNVNGVGSGHSNADSTGKVHSQAPSRTREIDPDPIHETKNVLRQIDGGNKGFVADYEAAYPHSSVSQRQEIMAYYPLGFLSPLHELAQQFTVCDNWFASVPGPTWTNRLFAMSGTSLGRVKMPTGIFDLNLHNYNQDSIFDRLADAGIPWRVYFGDFPLSLLLRHQQSPKRIFHHHDIGFFYKDARKAEKDFPAFSFIEPRYLPPGVDDDHPPHDVMNGEQLIAKVYNAIRANAELWKTTLLIILYDEHGGFFDHESPLAATPPDNHTEEYSFDRLGVRVPAVLVSPWVGKGVFSTLCDHTSVLRYLADKWSLPPLGRRAAGANSFASIIGAAGGPRQDTPTSVSTQVAARAVALTKAALAEKPLNDNQRAIISFSQHLEKQTRDKDANKVKRSMKMMGGPVNQVGIARQRARLFLKQRGAKL
jgi:phospholipase C